MNNRIKACCCYSLVARMDEQIPSLDLALGTESAPFEADRWLQDVSSGEFVEDVPQSFDDTDDEDDEGAKALRSLRNAGHARPIVDDPDFCYMCDGARHSTSAYAREIAALIETEGSNMSLQSMCKTVHRYYVCQVQPLTRKRWSLQRILEHITKHSVNPGVIRANNLRILLDYQMTICRFSRTIRQADQTEAPPDTGILSMQLKVMKAMDEYLRSSGPPPKRQRVVR